MPRNDDPFDPDDEPPEDMDDLVARGALLEYDDLPRKKPAGEATARSGVGRATTRTERTERRPGQPQRTTDSSFTSEPVAGGVITGPIANVKVALGRTIGLGNFTFARVDIAITMPCQPEDAERQYERSLGFVNERLTAELARARREGGGR